VNSPNPTDAGDTPRWRRVLSVVLLGIALVLGAYWLMLGATPPSVEADRLTFELVDLEGGRVAPDAERFAGKVLLVDIWGVWCGPCIAQIPYLVDLQRRYGHHGFEIIGVEFAAYLGDQHEDYVTSLREWAKSNSINYTLVQAGETSDVENIFPTLRDFAGFPTSILVGRDGTVRLVSQGFAPSEMGRFENVVKRLLLEKPSDAE
jgi:thiol-disulfide isomerase/thioredoxin